MINYYFVFIKCEFDKDKVEFLGYVLSGEGIATDPKKISSIKEWPKTYLCKKCTKVCWIM